MMALPVQGMVSSIRVPGGETSIRWSVPGTLHLMEVSPPGSTVCMHGVLGFELVISKSDPFGASFRR